MTTSVDLRTVHLTPTQIRRLLGLTDAEWALMDRERPAMSPREQKAVVADQQALEAIQERLKEAL